MKNLKSLIAICVLSLTALAGCQRMESTTESFVNKADDTQVLTLKSQPSLRYDWLGKSHNAEWAGEYTLKNNSGTISGTYTYVVDSGKKFRQYTFHPETGELWSAKVDSRGSFTDEKGNPWRIQQFRKDPKGLVSLQIFK